MLLLCIEMFYAVTLLLVVKLDKYFFFVFYTTFVGEIKIFQTAVTSKIQRHREDVISQSHAFELPRNRVNSNRTLILVVTTAQTIRYSEPEHSDVTFTLASSGRHDEYSQRHVNIHNTARWRGEQHPARAHIWHGDIFNTRDLVDLQRQHTVNQLLMTNRPTNNMQIQWRHWYIETRPSPLCVTMPNFVSLGQSAQAYVGCQKFCGRWGINHPLGWGVVAP